MRWQSTTCAVLSCRAECVGTPRAPRRRYNEPMSGSDRVNPASPGQKLTYDDFLLFPDDDGLRHELIDGEHYVTSAPNLRHQQIVTTLVSAIDLWLQEHPIGRIYAGHV